MSHYLFTNSWFLQTAKSSWDILIPSIKPKKILEVGSYEGASTCYLIDLLASESEDLEIHAIDTWEGGHDHNGIDMTSVKDKFDNNTKLAIGSKKVDLKIHKGTSDIELSRLLSTGFKNYFDFIYIDGSHQTEDVLTDAVLGFKLLKPQGVMAFDDYLWREISDRGFVENAPKLAIDAFININFSKLEIICALNSQVYISKKFEAANG